MLSTLRFGSVLPPIAFFRDSTLIALRFVAYPLLVPHSFSIPSFVRNLGKFSNSIPLLMIFDRRFLVTPFDPRPETRCNRRARPKEKFRQLPQPLAPTTLCVLFIYSYIPLILQVSLYISQSAPITHTP